MTSSFTLNSFGISDIGLTRKKNEDCFVSLPDDNFFALADGMGGHRAGEIAAKHAISSISDHFLIDASQATDIDSLKKPLFDSIIYANDKIHTIGRSHPSYHGMGTTLCCLFIKDGTALIGHVGDSRIYHLHDNTLTNLTQDHSLIYDLMQTGHIDKDEPISSPYKNIITKALGPTDRIEPEISTTPIHKGDIFLLSSDGLTDYVSERRIKYILSSSNPAEKKANQLVRHAKFKKSQDNITLIVVEII